MCICVYVYVCIYIYIHIHIHVHVHIHMHTYMYIYIYIHIFVRLTSARRCSSLQVFHSAYTSELSTFAAEFPRVSRCWHDGLTHVCIYVYMYVYIHVCTYIYIYTHTLIIIIIIIIIIICIISEVGRMRLETSMRVFVEWKANSFLSTVFHQSLIIAGTRIHHQAPRGDSQVSQRGARFGQWRDRKPEWGKAIWAVLCTFKLHDSRVSNTIRDELQCW